MTDWPLSDIGIPVPRCARCNAAVGWWRIEDAWEDYGLLITVRCHGQEEHMVLGADFIDQCGRGASVEAVAFAQPPLIDREYSPEVRIARAEALSDLAEIDRDLV